MSTEPNTGVSKDTDGKKATASTNDMEAMRPGQKQTEPEQSPDRPWRLTAAQDLSTAYLDFTPEPGGEAPVAREILDYALELGVAEDFLYAEETLSRALHNTINSGIPLKSYSISEDRDARFDIVVSTDKLKGELSISKAIGRGAPLDLKKLGNAIRKTGFQGMDIEKIRGDILAFNRSKELNLDDYLLVQGTPPVPGKPRELSWEVEFLDKDAVEALKRKDREAPRPEVQTIASLAELPVADVPEMAYVKGETVIVNLSPHEPGTAGVDVFGSPILLPDTTSEQFKILEHIRLGQDCIIAEQDGILDRWPHGKTGNILRVRPFRDAVVTVNVSDNAMLASVKLVEGIGSGIHLSTELVRQALIADGVIKGIDLEAVEDAIQRASADGDDSEIVVARGQPPVEPGEGRLKFHVPFASGKGVTLRSDGTADFKNQDRITSVKAGQLVAEVVTESVDIADGWDVHSKVIKGDASQRLPVQIGDGIRRETAEEGLDKIYAEKAGELVFDGGALAVAAIHTIEGDVGASSGNIKFNGSVNITGTVRSGFFVMSKGAVKIAEGVEASLISADEAIHIVNGVKGGGKAVLRARQEMSANFIERATVMAVEDVTVQNTCLNCTIKCNGAVSLVTEKGRLVGGSIRARNGVSAQQIGSKGGVQTRISFGQDYLIGDKAELEEREIGKLQKELVRLEGLIRVAEREKAIADVKKGRARKLQVLKLLEKRTERLFWLRERFEQHYESKIEVRGTVFPGVVLESHGRTLEITYEKKNVMFYFDQDMGRIVEKVPEKAGLKQPRR